MKQDQLELKPFLPVLVRDSDDQNWCADFYSHYDNQTEQHCCISAIWNQIIPYNTNTMHLIGTKQSYEPLQPKRFEVLYGKNCSIIAQFTEKEFKNFIEIAVLRNKDVSNFTVKKICG